MSANMSQSYVNQDRMAEKFCSNLDVVFDRIPSKLGATAVAKRFDVSLDGKKKVLGERIKKRGGGNWKKVI